MSLTQERKIALECANEYVDGNLTLVDAMLHFLSRIREEQEPDAYRAFNRAQSCYEYARDEEDVQMKYTNTPEPLFTIPPAISDCSELVKALEKYDQIVRITVSRLVRQYGKEDDEYATELRECLGYACEALAKHKAMMGEK